MTSGREHGQLEASLETLAPEPAAVPKPEPGPTDDREPEQTVAQIGRHVVIRKLGAGAMGVVFAAYDPELDRDLRRRHPRRAGLHRNGIRGRDQLAQLARRPPDRHARPPAHARAVRPGRPWAGGCPRGRPRASRLQARQRPGRRRRSREVFVDTRARYVAELGPDHPRVAEVDNELGGLAWRTGDYETALKYYRSALDIRTRAFGARHSSLSGLIANIGATQAMKGEFEQAVHEFERAVDILRDLDDAPLLASNLDNLAGAEAMLEHFDRARELYNEAYEIRRAIYTDDHPDLARSLINMGQLEIEAGRPEQAVAMLERALVLREGVDVQPTYRARARWKLAEALWMLGKTQRVRELLEGAAEDYRAAGMAGSEQQRFEAKVLLMLGEPL